MADKKNKLMEKMLMAGDDLVASIKKANWGTIRHSTLHMEYAMAMWQELTKDLKPKDEETPQ